ncbi:MAG: hybrid sensor histidine kinase/response regulator [Bordetella sp.]|uniref:hybrid sensor histidine kinase/response regulator n=1 Tax=Bordetella sp. TaxID=28081 RepID=UPI003F7C9909
MGYIGPGRNPVAAATQKIFRIRRSYNAWVADETMEDYALRYTPGKFRKWSELRVANTAFGAVSFLAMEAIGGTIALNYGFTNAVVAILVVGLVTFLTGLPIGYYAARYGVDMDLLTRGAGFGYLGSTITSLIYASFTFIFFALEAAIMALALQISLGIDLIWCYLLSALVIIPLAVRGITLISRLQAWTQPFWLLLLLVPYAVIAWVHPQAFSEFAHFAGRISGGSGFDLSMFGASVAVAFSLIVQIGEQVDFLRFLPKRNSENRARWWAVVLLAGPGWIVPGVLKMLGGAFLAYLAVRHGVEAAHATEPTQMYLTAYSYVFNSPALIVGVATLFVVISQVKINVTNAYAGSLAWSNFFARLTRSHPGRVVWLVFNVMIALTLMVMDVFHAIERVLGLFSNIGIAWVGALVADLVINKPLGLSPPGIEFKRGHLYDINPVGIGAMVLAAVLSIAAHVGILGTTAQALAPLIALAVSMAVAPAIAWLTKGRYYIARTDTPAFKPGESVRCGVCENVFESEDMSHCPAYDASICSLCCSLESRCHDRCKTGSRAAEQAKAVLAAVLPKAFARRVNFRVAHYLLVFLSLSLLLFAVMGVVYVQESGEPGGGIAGHALQALLFKISAILLLIIAVCSWWVVLASESRRMAQDESNRQNHLLTQEIEAHQRTDAALQAVKESAEAANQAKTRYVAGITHELRTPLNSILGYSQILTKNEALAPSAMDGVKTIHRSAEHMLALVDGLLDLARIEAGRLRLDNAPLALPVFLDELVTMVRPQIEGKGLQFTYTHSGPMPEWVLADAKYLRQILINLLSNAARFTDVGRVSLHVDCLHEVLIFQVEDTGIGIAPQDEQRIFSPFERGATGRRRAEGGTGLGLTITALLASLMGGELALVRTSKAGSLFQVRLYLRKVSAPGVLTDMPLRAAGYLGERKCLLVVDDQPVQRQMLAGMLVPVGFDFLEAASGTECLEFLATSPRTPDAILLDITMDDMDGWETARHIRTAGYEMPIILVSATVFENRQPLLQAAGCQAFVGKPVIESELMQTLQRHLGLEWLAAEPPRITDDDVADSAIYRPVRLPGDFHARALRELRIGHVNGLASILEDVRDAHPELAADCERLGRLLGRFDLDGLKQALVEVQHDHE